ncbi:Putative E3 ubiquitin-protein ligase SH3RF2, partial [Opisthocomus hoazin]
MDDLALLDLLECPVCFEKLDATAKVLPCQHTFCKPCLQRILKSQKELRCPECRTLVLCSIEQLPSNLFLIRLLDGVRCGQNAARFGSIQRSGVLSSPASIRRGPRALPLHQHRLATNPRIHMDGVPRAKALYTYRGHNPGELRFNKGDIIVLLRQLDENWYLGEVNGISGVFPASSVQVIKHLPLPPPLGRGLYSADLRSRDKAENKDCLTLHKMGKEGKKGKLSSRRAVPGVTSEKRHHVSLCLFQPNTTARQLLQTSKSHWSPQFKSASLRMASPKAKGADSPAFPKAPDSRRKSLRQFSITTALNTLNRMVHAPAERPGAHVGVNLLFSLLSFSLQVSASYYAAPGSLGHSAAIVTLPHLQHHVSAYMCVALHPYVAHGPDELELQKGEGVRVFGKDHDGWLRGMSLVTGRAGIFPSNYVAPLFRSGSSYTKQKHAERGAGDTRGAGFSPSRRQIPAGAPAAPARARDPLPRRDGTWQLALLLLLRGSVWLHAPCGNRCFFSSRGARQGVGERRADGAGGRTAQHQPLSAGSTPWVLASAASPVTLQFSPGALAETRRPNLSHEASPALAVRGGESRAPSVCSSVTLDARDPPARSEAAPKPPASAPPSILVKPDTSRNSAEK